MSNWQPARVVDFVLRFDADIGGAIKMGVEAIKKWADEGVKPEPTPGKAFFDTGVALITDKPAEGVPSIDTTKGTELCWG